MMSPALFSGPRDGPNRALRLYGQNESQIKADTPDPSPTSNQSKAEFDHLLHCLGDKTVISNRSPSDVNILMCFHDGAISFIRTR